MDVVDRDSRAIRSQGRDGGIAEPDRFLIESARAVVFAQQVAGFVVGVEDRAGGAAADLDPLAEGRFGGRAVGEGFEAPGVVIRGARGVAIS